MAVLCMYVEQGGFLRGIILVLGLGETLKTILLLIPLGDEETEAHRGDMTCPRPQVVRAQAGPSPWVLLFLVEPSFPFIMLVLGLVACAQCQNCRTDKCVVIWPIHRQVLVADSPGRVAWPCHIGLAALLCRHVQGGCLLGPLWESGRHPGLQERDLCLPSGLASAPSLS